ncbi:MAG TPA: glycosyltransferase family 39 protein [Rudaea sp.]|nr:glycosyltransferase family 39 protein [Rudaea sp.]
MDISSSRLRALLLDWRLYWVLLLLPVALFLPALPIDETRYLAVAWEMRLHGDFLVPHLNGAPYSDKPPLLFWLVNLGWLVAGMHAWAVRLGVLAASFASLALFERLVRRLEPDGALASRAVPILAGMVYIALFSSAIMFDVLLTTWVLLALHGALDLDAQRWRRGTLLLALGFGLGVLTKGPVVLLDAGLCVALAPWWSDTARVHKGRWYGCLGLGVLGGAALALAWAIPAAIAGGPDYANAIFLHQTVDRMTKSFAHRRPLWWYFMVLPAMVLPWTLALRAPWRAWRDSFHISKTARFAAAWFVPAFLAFCLVSGKQPHYLLPLLPGLALLLGGALGNERARVRGRLFAAVLLAVGLALAALPYVAAHAHDFAWLDARVRAGQITESFLAVIAGVWPLWGILAAAVAACVLVAREAHASLRALALAAVAAAACGELALAQGIGPYVDVSVAAAHIKADQDAGRPIAHLAWHHGLFEFAGRLTQPLEKVSYADLHAWCTAHPDGEIVTFYTKYPITAKPELELPYRFGRIIFWRARDLLDAPLPAAPAKPDEDEAPED